MDLKEFFRNLDPTKDKLNHLNRVVKNQKKRINDLEQRNVIQRRSLTEAYKEIEELRKKDKETSDRVAAKYNK
jgi:septal ring factor EnvC (AmiA/AmiB activator)